MNDSHGAETIARLLWGEDPHLLPIGDLKGKWWAIAQTVARVEDRLGAFRECIGRLNGDGEAIVQAVFAIGPGDPKPIESRADSPYETTTLAQLLDGPTDVDWLLEPLIPPASTVFLVGDSGVGKTWTICDLALSVATGGKWLGHFLTKQGTVLLVDEENSELLLRLRLIKMLKGRNLQRDLPIHFLVGKAVNLTPTRTDGSSTITSVSAGRLLDTIRETRASLVICDSLTRIHRSNENSSSEMSAVFANIKQITNQTGASFFITHHVNKYGTGKSGQRIRGSTDIRAFCDTTIHVEQAEGAIRLTHDKSRWCERIAPFTIKIIGNQENDTITLVYQGESASSKKADDDDRAWLCVKRQLAQGPQKREKLVERLEDEGLCSERKLADILRQKVDEGLLVRRPDEHDRRRTIYSLPSSSPEAAHETPAGEVQ